jgi:hypothetical protein
MSGPSIAPIPVTITREGGWVTVADVVLSSVIQGYVLTWLAPIITGGAWAPGFWASVATVVLIRSLVSGDYVRWTTPRNPRTKTQPTN